MLLQLSPNPTGGLVWVFAPEELAALSILDATGRRIMDVKLPEAGSVAGFRIDLGHLPAGVYFLQGQTQRGGPVMGRVMRQ